MQDLLPVRDRDDAGRARNARPRDGLGRPLPYGSSGVEREPEGVRRSPADTIAQAQDLLDRGRPFHAHEVLEDAWKQAPEGERALWRGLAQAAVGLTHRARGNARGAAALLRRADTVLEPFAADRPHGIDVAGVRAQLQGLVERLADGVVDGGSGENAAVAGGDDAAVASPLRLRGV